MANDPMKQKGVGANDQPPAASDANAEGWSIPQPEKVPRQTYMPATLALGVTALLWGLITSYLISLVGLVVIAIAMVFWIGDIRHEH